ncbi:MAG: ABC transporter permease [Desulfurococcaceae archaeon]
MGHVLKFEARTISPLAYVAVPLLGFGAAFAVGALLMKFVAGVDPAVGYGAFFAGALSPNGVASIVSYTTLFTLMAVGIAVSNRAGVFNVGAEGQYVVGAMAATSVALALQAMNVSSDATLLAAMVVAAVAGGAWGLFAGALRAYLGINEIVTTVIMNWLAYRIMQWALRGPLKLPGPQMWPMSPPILASIPTFPGTSISTAIAIALGIALFSYFMLFRSEAGYKIRAVGHNPAASAYAGINVRKLMALSMLYSGMMAGLAGAVEVLAFLHYLFEGIFVGLGYTAILVALVGANNPIGIIASSLFFGIIYTGNTYLQAATGLTYTFSKALEGLIYLFVLVGTLLTSYRIRLVRV